MNSPKTFFNLNKSEKVNLIK